MKKKENIVSYSVSDIKRLIEQGAALTDWNRVDKMTEAELEASIDPEDDIGNINIGNINWETVTIGMPNKKQDVHIRLDADLLSWLKKSGKGYQTRINAILRSYMMQSFTSQ